jgi:hypothetical protein
MIWIWAIIWLIYGMPLIQGWWLITFVVCALTSITITYNKG